MDKKHFLKSKTVWFNSLTILVVAATFLGYTPDQKVAELTSNTLLLAAPLINIVLRKLTSKPI